MKNTISKEELDLYLEKLNIALKSDIEDIQSFDHGDIVYLEKEMLKNLRNLKKTDVRILRLARKLNLMQEKEERLSRQVSYTKDSILDDMDYEIKKSIAVIVVYGLISSNNFQEFLRKIIILLMINIITFKANLDYFTSDERKILVEKRLSKLRENIRDEKMYYELYRGINKCFTLKLDIQYDKLLELYPEINEEEIKVRKRK